jgi:hypothetical protein
MQLFIPDIGTLVKLEQDWTFTLYDEYRNQSLFEKLNKKRENQIVELPKGLVLKIDRIYVRKGLSQYSSITFRVPNPKSKIEKEYMPFNEEFNKVLFWVKLHEVNGTEFSIVNKNKETKELFESFYSNLEKDTIEKFGVQKCTKLMAQINRLLGSGININNFSTHENYDQFMNKMMKRIKKGDFMEEFLTSSIKQEIRDFKIKKLVE